jgi:hypothetical protein
MQANGSAAFKAGLYGGRTAPPATSHGFKDEKQDTLALRVSVRPWDLITNDFLDICSNAPSPGCHLELHPSAVCRAWGEEGAEPVTPSRALEQAQADIESGSKCLR